jgi:hypothetical protein
MGKVQAVEKQGKIRGKKDEAGRERRRGERNGSIKARGEIGRFEGGKGRDKI